MTQPKITLTYDGGQGRQATYEAMGEYDVYRLLEELLHRMTVQDHPVIPVCEKVMVT